MPIGQFSIHKEDSETLKQLIKDANPENPLVKDIQHFLDMPSFTVSDDNGNYELGFCRSIAVSENQKDDNPIVLFELHQTDGNATSSTIMLSDATVRELALNLLHLLDVKKEDPYMLEIAERTRAAYYL